MHFEAPTIPAFDYDSANAARDRQNNLVKPSGSLGRLEEISIQIAGIRSKPIPSLEKKTVIIMVADHGVCEEDICAYSSDVTHQMVEAYLKGKAAINSLAAYAGASTRLIDMGVNYDFTESPNLTNRKIARGTGNISKGPAMTQEQVLNAVAVGMTVAEEEAQSGTEIIAIGEMGVGNTTAASAIISSITGVPVSSVTGRGTGLDNSGLTRKIAVIEKAIQINQPDPSDPLDVLMKLGGFEIAGMVGVILGAAIRRIPVVVDGLISSAAALIAYELHPELRMFLLAGHKTVEVGQQAVMERIGIKPILDMHMRLGEGTGAVLALNIIESACLVLKEMGTFTEIGVEFAP